MEEEGGEKGEVEANKETTQLSENSPELRVYLHLLILLYLLDHDEDKNACVKCADAVVEVIEKHNKRILDPLMAKVFFYYARAHELAGRSEEIRAKLLSLQRTMVLRHHFASQITLLNLLLRNYLTYNLIDSADKLATKTEIKEDAAAPAQLARYYYYMGRIKAIQLRYSDAVQALERAGRKGPKVGARGFRAAVTKLKCIVHLLIGDIPERSVFREVGITSLLKPYLELTQVVRKGNLEEFHVVVKQHADRFREDGNLSLIQRLRHNVIKTGLRRINLSYSRISLADVKDKLKLESVADAEFVVSKAIRDGIIEASIDHEGGFLRSKENPDVYSTTLPQVQFHKRIAFCMDMHNEAVKSMRFPPDANKKEKEDEDGREEDIEQRVKEAQEEDDDDEI